DAIERRLLMPEDDGLATGQREPMERVAVAVAAGEDDDADAHGHQGTASTGSMASIAYASMSGFASSSEARRSTTARADAASDASALRSTRHPTREAVE